MRSWLNFLPHPTYHLFSRSILLPVHVSSGRKGIGLGKRAASPTELERLAKTAKLEEETSKESFRDRARREFEQKRAEHRLFPAQNTCVTLDEKAGKKVCPLKFLILCAGEMANMMADGDVVSL